MKKKTSGKRGRVSAPTQRARETRSGAAPDRDRDRNFRKAVDMLRLADEESRRRRSEFEGFVRANRHLPCVERAEAWLRFIAADPEGYGDQEALVYLTQRGEDCSPMIQKLNEDSR